MKLSIIIPGIIPGNIPVLNERDPIKEILTRIDENSVLSDYHLTKEIIVVNNGFSEGARAILKEIEKEKAHIKMIDSDSRAGIGGAIKAGLRQCAGDIILVQNACTEYDPDDYRKLIRPVVEKRADVVFGSRISDRKEERIRHSRSNGTTRFLSFCSNLFSGRPLTHMESDCKVWTRKVSDSLELEEDGFGIEPEIVAKLAELSRKEKVRVHEVGISRSDSSLKEGKGLGIRDTLRALWCIFKYNTSGFARLFKYISNGFIVALSQFVSIYLFVEYLGMDTKLLKNVAHALSIEVSIVVGFLLHSFITWRYAYPSVRAVRAVLKTILSFHLVTAFSFVIRVILFYILLNFFGIDYVVNTFIGIVVAVMLNFFGYDQIVFTHKRIKGLPNDRLTIPDRRLNKPYGGAKGENDVSG